jgi:hypothetical protein
MRLIIIPLICALLVCGTADARPKHWYTDWKVYVGLGVITGAVIADGQSTCLAFSHGYVEAGHFGRGNTSCAKATIGVTAAGALYGTTYILQARHFEESNSRAWRAISLVALPAIVVAGHGSAAIHNYDLLSKGN